MCELHCNVLYVYPVAIIFNGRSRISQKTPTPEFEAKPITWQDFRQNGMKMKEVGPREGGACPWHPFRIRQ